jgi:hypothetical protein
VSINALSGVIAQLGSLAKHADQIFTGLIEDASFCFQRAQNNSIRIGDLQDHIQRLDYRNQGRWQVHPHLDFHQPVDVSTKVSDVGFRQRDDVEQQVISHMSLPLPIMEQFQSCEPPPNLSSLNAYRDDGKSSSAFYTDPDFFFRQWCNEMEQETDLQLQKKKHKKVRLFCSVV